MEFLPHNHSSLITLLDIPPCVLPDTIVEDIVREVLYSTVRLRYMYPRYDVRALVRLRQVCRAFKWAVDKNFARRVNWRFPPPIPTTEEPNEFNMAWCEKTLAFLDVTGACKYTEEVVLFVSQSLPLAAVEFLAKCTKLRSLTIHCRHWSYLPIIPFTGVLPCPQTLALNNGAMLGPLHVMLRGPHAPEHLHIDAFTRHPSSDIITDNRVAIHVKSLCLRAYNRSYLVSLLENVDLKVESLEVRLWDLRDLEKYVRQNGDWTEVEEERWQDRRTSSHRLIQLLQAPALSQGCGTIRIGGRTREEWITRESMLI